MCCTDLFSCVFGHLYLPTCMYVYMYVAGKCDQLKKRAFIVDLPEEIITKDALKASGLDLVCVCVLCVCVCALVCVCVLVCVFILCRGEWHPP